MRGRGLFWLQKRRLYQWKDLPYTAKGHPLQRLDVYIPKEPFPRELLPTCIFLHGGSWQRGDKQYGYIRNVGKLLASTGNVAVVINYRLSPQVVHPEHAQDVAEGIEWVKANIQTFGGDPTKIVLLGHSAGAHLAMYLASHADYASVFRKSVLGIIGISGAYNIVRLANTFYGCYAAYPAFGKTSQKWREATPSVQLLSSSSESTPAIRLPVLLMTAQTDLHMNSDADDLEKILREKGNLNVKRITIAERNHWTILTHLIKENDQGTMAIHDFINSVVTP